MAGGVALIIVGENQGVNPVTEDRYGSARLAIVFGDIATGCGAILGATCVIVGKKMEKRIQNELQYSTLWQEEIPLKNGTSLMTGVDMLKDNRTNTLGIGIRYNF